MASLPEQKQRTRNAMQNETWKASDASRADYLGTMEIETKSGDFHIFEVLLIPGDRYIFGGACNAGFLESGFMRLESDEGEMSELNNQLTAYYDEGPQYAPRLVCNERM